MKQNREKYRSRPDFHNSVSQNLDTTTTITEQENEMKRRKSTDFFQKLTPIKIPQLEKNQKSIQTIQHSSPESPDLQNSESDLTPQSITNDSKIQWKNDTKRNINQKEYRNRNKEISTAANTTATPSQKIKNALKQTWNTWTKRNESISKTQSIQINNNIHIQYNHMNHYTMERASQNRITLPNQIVSPKLTRREDSTIKTPKLQNDYNQRQKHEFEVKERKEEEIAKTRLLQMTPTIHQKQEEQHDMNQDVDSRTDHSRSFGNFKRETISEQGSGYSSKKKITKSIKQFRRHRSTSMVSITQSLDKKVTSCIKQTRTSTNWLEEHPNKENRMKQFSHSIYIPKCCILMIGMIITMSLIFTCWIVQYSLIQTEIQNMTTTTTQAIRMKMMETMPMLEQYPNLFEVTTTQVTWTNTNVYPFFIIAIIIAIIAIIGIPCMIIVIDRWMMKGLFQYDVNSLFDEENGNQKFSFFSEIKQIQYIVALLKQRLALYKEISPKVIRLIERHFTQPTSLSENNYVNDLSDDSKTMSPVTNNKIAHSPSLMSPTMTPSRIKQFSFSASQLLKTPMSPTCSLISANTDQSYGPIENEIGLQPMALTTMTIRIANAYELLKTDPGKYIEQYGELFRAVHDRLATAHALLLYFSHSKLVLLWTERDAINHTVRSCTIARSLQSTFRDLNEKWQIKFAFHIGISSASQENAQFGYIGLSEISTPFVLGHVLEISQSLSSLAAEWSIPILIDETIHAKARAQFLTRPIAYDHRVVTPSGKLPSILVRAYELGLVKEKTDGKEWLYEMKNRQQLKLWDSFHEAFSEYEQGFYENALHAFTQFLKEREENDPPTLKFIAQCKSKMMTRTPSLMMDSLPSQSPPDFSAPTISLDTS